MLYTYNNRQMKTSQYFVGKTLILFGAIIIGIPLGIIHGLILFFKVAISHPYNLYTLSLHNWLESVELKEGDIWARHIDRIEKNKNNYDN